VDVIFPRARIAVFVDGCFWHGCPEHGVPPKANARFWHEKIHSNKERDRETNQALARAGFLVIRVWEHEDPDRAAAKIESAVRERQPRLRPPSTIRGS
jgi:DNA mismatch endonuclease (patch repair protein)